MRTFLFLNGSTVFDTVLVGDDSASSSEVIREYVTIDEDGELVCNNKYGVETVLELNKNNGTYIEYRLESVIMREVRITV